MFPSTVCWVVVSHICLSLQMVGTLKALAVINAPRILMQLVILIYKANTDMTMDLDMVEYFAGCMAVPRFTHPLKLLLLLLFWVVVVVVVVVVAVAVAGAVAAAAVVVVVGGGGGGGGGGDDLTEVTRCWSRCGFDACPYEILLDGSFMDILSPIGPLGRS